MFGLDLVKKKIMDVITDGQVQFECIEVLAKEYPLIVSTFKEAEDGNGFILRCYETLGSETTVSIEIPLLNRKWKTKFGKCEIKTFRISDYCEKIVETDLIEL